MKLFLSILFILFFMNSQTIFDFNTQTKSKDWKIIDDVVMGGKSNGNFSIDSDGNGVFSGTISLENNGGFSSVRYNCEPVATTNNSKVKIRLKGDGKDYQFRIKDKASSYYSYITTFKTNGNWETITIDLKDLYPSFRGQTLDFPNYKSASFEEIVFLIGNKKNEPFKLLLDKIEIE